MERTERLLRDALASLLHEKPYADIVVKEILARADVGRSTFYAHFRDKDELLASCVHAVLGAAYADGRPAPASPRDRVLGFSRRVLDFHARHRARNAAVDGETRAVLHERLQSLLATRIAADLRPDSRDVRSGPGLPPDLLARHAASTFGLVLEWWLDGNKTLAPREVDAMFRALVAPVLDAAS